MKICRDVLVVLVGEQSRVAYDFYFILFNERILLMIKPGQPMLIVNERFHEKLSII